MFTSADLAKLPDKRLSALRAECHNALRTFEAEGNALQFVIWQNRLRDVDTELTRRVTRRYRVDDKRIRHPLYRRDGIECAGGCGDMLARVNQFKLNAPGFTEGVYCSGCIDRILTTLDQQDAEDSQDAHERAHVAHF